MRRRLLLLLDLAVQVEKLDDAAGLRLGEWGAWLQLMLPARYAGPEQKAKPIRANPGTTEKISTLRERAALGLELFHPNDGK